jgi:uncharacterized protein
MVVRLAARGPRFAEVALAVALDPLLLEILACPEDKGPLLYFPDEETLYNPRLHRRYLINDDIPNMLIDDADEVAADEHERLMAKARADGTKLNFEISPGQDATGQEP